MRGRSRIEVVLLRVAKGEETGQPAAADMRELVWDDELEAIAQRWRAIMHQ